VLDDVDRTGAPLRPGARVGVGAFFDFRLRGWQVDVRGGFSPPDGVSLFTALGWAWTR
jgi:hypothetical protein